IFAACRTCFAALRALDFAEVYFLNFSPLSFACASLFSPEQCRGYARVDGQDMRSTLFSLAFNLMRDRRFAPVNLADLWAFLHRDPVAPEKVNPIARPAATGCVGIIAAGRHARRSLPPRVLAACVQSVFRAAGGPRLLCLGAKEDQPAARRLRRELPPRIAERMEDLTGKTSLTDLPDILRGLDMLLTPDTGAMHLAAHLGIPVQAFFLSSAWCFETGPYGMGHRVWQAVRPCSPCLESAPCPHGTACCAPFSHPAFQTHLAGKFSPEWPADLMGCVSALDDFGATCTVVDGGNPYADAARELRAGLAACRGLPGADAGGLTPRNAAFLFREKDWMLPGNWNYA
ncbi:MAG: glycosyltransferase family 9 protein, partial [Desulfovibrio sp.]|nr:glycosyltransferase family 9 protein [Desulfovibrio sp.]